LSRNNSGAEAIEQCRLVLTMHPTGEQRIATQWLLAGALLSSQRFAEAAAEYGEYLKMRPGDGSALTNRGPSAPGCHQQA